jgi:hypothetical protein
MLRQQCGLNENVMNDTTEHTQTMRLARRSRFLGTLTLMLLLLSALFGVAWSREHVDVLGLQSHGEVICQAIAAALAIVALYLGIFALVKIRRGAGKIEGRRHAISGIVTASVTLLPLLVAYGVVLPIVAWREGQEERKDKLKVLGLAMLTYHDAYGHFPPAVLHDPALGDRAKPYSWRVAILPIIGEYQLYCQYRRDEPWDSPANRELLARMPAVFALPGSARAAAGLTHYQVLVGPGTAFERPDMRVRVGDFARGTAQTILAVEAADPVPWTKPDDLPFSPDGPLPKVGGLWGKGFYALYAEGTVRWINAEEQETVLRTQVPLK